MEANLDEFKGLKRWYGDQPECVRVAAILTLNAFAFGTRTLAVRRINETMTVRNSKFVSGRMQVTKARKSASFRTMHSVTGSVAVAGSSTKGDFTGWTEQEYGTRDKRKRSATRLGRNGNYAKQIRHIVRLKPRNEVISRGDYGMSSEPRSRFFAAALRKKENRLIATKGAIFKRRRNKLEPVQLLNRPKQTKRDKWLLTSRNNYFKSTNLDALWRRNYGSAMRPPPKR